jgi:hypothetical protein
MAEIYGELKEAMKLKDGEKITQILKKLDLKNVLKSEEKSRQIERKAPQSNDDDEDAYNGEVQNEARMTSVQKKWDEFVKKMTETSPDPVVNIFFKRSFALWHFALRPLALRPLALRPLALRPLALRPLVVCLLGSCNSLQRLFQQEQQSKN